MPGTRISGLPILTGAGSANDDDLIIFDTSTGLTKRISRSQLAAGLVGDLPFTPVGIVAATTLATAVAELAVEAGAGVGDMLKSDNLSGLTNYTTARTNMGLTIGTNVQAFNANLTTFAGITPSANIQTLLGAANYAAARTSLSLVPGTDVQAYSSVLVTYAGINPSANVQTVLGCANFAAIRTALTLVPGTDVQAYSGKLAALAASTAVTGTITAGTAAASGGSDGDVYYKYI